MKIFYTFILSILAFYSHAQNIDWEARVNNVRSREGGIGGDCWESGDEEYTSLFSVRDNTMGSFSGAVCVTCNNNGDCEYGGGTFIASNSNINATTLTVNFDAWEDDAGARCTHDGADDCRCANSNLANLNIRSGTLCDWSNFGDFGCGSHDRIRIGIRWRWSTAQFQTQPTNQTACEGTNATFSAALNSSFNGGVTYQWQFWNGSSWVNQGTASTTYSNLVVAATSSINGRQYRLIAIQCDYGGTRTTASNTVTLTVQTNSVAPGSVLGNSTRCGSGAETFTVSGGSLGTGATWRWYTGSCGGTFVGSGTSITPTVPVGSTTYFVRAEGTCNTTACASRTIVVNNPSTPMNNATITPAAVCSGTSVSVNATGGTLGTSASWRWYSNPTFTTLVATGNPVSINPVTNPVVYVRAEDATSICSPSSAYTVNLSGVAVHTSSLAASATNYTSTPALVCQGDNVTISLVGGTLGNFALWYLYDSNPTMGSPTPLASNSSGTFTVTPSANTTYYIRAQNLCGNTAAVTANVIINGSSSSSGSLVSASASSTCLVNDANWHYFRNGAGDVIAAINSNGQDLGDVTISVVTGDDGPFGSGGPSGDLCNTVGGEYHVARYFNISSDNPASSDVSVRLFFTSAEYTSHKSTSDAQSSDYQYCYGTTSSASDLIVSVFPTSGPAQAISSIARSLGGGPSSSNEFEFDIEPYTVSPRLAGSQNMRYDNLGTTLYIHNQGARFDILPVELTSFTGQYEDLAVQLDWSTASEFNNSHFEIQRSVDANVFETIGKVNGRGTVNTPSDYGFVDANALPGVVYYYRLKQVDFDGKFEYSGVISVETPSVKGIVVGNFYPSPATDLTTLSIVSDKSAMLNMSIFNSSGALVSTKVFELTEGLNTIQVNAKEFSAGVYVVNIEVADVVKGVKLLIQK